MIRELLTSFHSNNLDDAAAPPHFRSRRPRGTIALIPWCPPTPMQPYDIKDVIHAVADDNYFFEVQEHFAKNIVIGFARLGGSPLA